MEESILKRKKIRVLISFLMLFLPIGFLVYLDKEWQIVLIFLVASTITVGLINIDDFEIFKITKEGIELKRAIREAKVTLDEVSKLSINSLKLTLRQAFKLGNFSGLQALVEYNFYMSYYNSLKGIDKELDEMMTNLENTMNRSLSVDYLKVFVELLSNDNNLKSEEIDKFNAIIKKLNPKGLDLDEYQYNSNFYLERKELINITNEALSFIDKSRRYMVGDYKDSVDLYQYFLNVKNEIEKTNIT